MIVRKTTCSKCGEPGFRFRGDRWLCLIHNRIDTMVNAARAAGKVIPTITEFNDLIAAAVADQMRCGHCRETMVWHSEGSKSKSVSLQHDRCGRITLLCSSCNSRHAAFPGDTFYDHPPGFKWCPSCSTAKPITGFFSPAKKSKGRAQSYCRICRAEFQRIGYSNTRAKYASQNPHDGSDVAGMV